MPNVPLPKGINGLAAFPKQKEMLVNLFWSENGIMRTPGLDLATEVADSGCRGVANWYVDGKGYFVIGQSLYQFDGVTATNLGAIAGSSDCVLSSGQISLVIIVKGGNGYTYNADDGLVQITDPDFLPCDSVDFMDGRHVFIPSDGSPAFYSDIDSSGSISPLSFFDAEELPDLNRFTINISNQLYIGGSQAFEVFRSSGDNTAPFIRREGGRVDVGYVGASVRYKDTFAFIGSRRDQGYTICAMASGDVVELANSAIVELLNGFTKSQLEAATVDSFEFKKSTFLVWTIADISIAFIDGQWIYLDSDLNGTESGPWRAVGGAFCNGRYYFGDRETGKIGRLSDSFSEYESHTEYWLTTFARSERNSYFSVSSLEVDVLTGQGAETIGLSVSDDGRAWSDFNYLDLGDIGEYQRRIEWSGGLGCYENFMGITLRGTGEVQFALESMNVTT